MGTEDNNVLSHVAAVELLDLLHDGAYLVDQNRLIQHWNRAAERLTGFGAEEVVGRSCGDDILVHVDNQGEVLCGDGCPLTGTMQDGESRTINVYMRHKKGHRVPVRVRVAPVKNGSGEIVGAMETFTDDSSQRDLSEKVEVLERIAMLDQLTQVPNRRYLEEVMAASLFDLTRYGWSFGVLLFDVDNFKKFNDTHGHDLGDEVLQVVANTLTLGARTSDVAGRWGEEEFLCVVKGADVARAIGVAADRMRSLVATAAVPSAEGPLGLTVSAGGACARAGDTAASLIKRADGRLCEAKNGGRDMAVVTSGCWPMESRA